MRSSRGIWTGPVESPYELHLVLVPERVAPAWAALAEVRPAVEREFVAERRRSEFQALYERLLARDSVTIEMSMPEKKATSADAPLAGAQ